MSFYCKPSGGFGVSTNEGINNINAYYNWMIDHTTYNNIVGQLCNIQSESGFNPWRWQSDRYYSDQHNGYGLYQFTPASSYINLTDIPLHAPNLSTSGVVGGDQSDAYAQMYVFINDTLNKWKKSCWRTYYNDEHGNPLYPDLYAKRTSILNTYGDGSEITLQQFLNIDNIEDACFTFLICYEGPGVPNLTERLNNQQGIIDALGGSPPPPPPPPPPPYQRRGSMPLYMMLRF